MDGLIKAISDIKNLPVMVVGDLMLDTFVYGDVDRISPESPVPVLTINAQDQMLGGAGNVFSSLVALGVKPVVFSVVGEDVAGDKVRAMIESNGAAVTGVITDSSRPTILKTRYLARHQQLLRSDIEKTHPLDKALQTKMLTMITAAMSSVRAVILSDYGKGVLTPELIHEVISLATKGGIPVFVDPKGQDFSIYRGAFAITPNRKELALAAGTGVLKSDDEIVSAAQKIIHECGVQTILATRSEDGLSVIAKNTTPVHIPTKAREVFDVSGAGDTVIATFAAAIGAGADVLAAATLANLAGGIAVSKVGTTPVRTDEILQALFQNPKDVDGFAPLLGPKEAAEHVKKWQSAGLRVGLTNGCFDILHAGHVRYLMQTRKHCDRLIVALNHDDSIRLLKGPTRPVNDKQARAVVLGALACVDAVVFFGANKAGEDNTPCALLSDLRPDLYFKGGDYKKEQLPETKIVESYGGQVLIMNHHEGFSTTGIIERSRKNA